MHDHNNEDNGVGHPFYSYHWFDWLSSVFASKVMAKKMQENPFKQ